MTTDESKAKKPQSETEAKPTENKPAEAKSTEESDWATRIKTSRFFNDNAPTKDNKWGYDLYPERKKLFQASLARIAMMKEGRETYDKMKCEENVYNCVKKSPLVKLMMGALRASGW